MKKYLKAGDRGLCNDRKMRGWNATCELAATILYVVAMTPACFLAAAKGTANHFMLETCLVAFLFVFEATAIWLLEINSHYGDLPVSFGLSVILGFILGAIDVSVLIEWSVDRWALIKDLNYSALDRAAFSLDWSAFPEWPLMLIAAYAFVTITLDVCMLIGYRRDKKALESYNDTMLNEAEKPLTFLEYCEMLDPSPKSEKLSKS